MIGAPGLRRLTVGEQALARDVFRHGLEPRRIRILFLPGWRRAFVAGAGLIVWPAAQAVPDFSQAPLALQGTFVHELAHVWQAQNGVNLLVGKIRAGDRPGSYAYDLASGPAFADLNIEQQAMVVEHAFLAARGAPAPHPPEIYAAVEAAWRRA